MKKVEKYCTKCGLELCSVATGEFDELTGKHTKKLVCPTRLCNHSGVANHKWDFYREGFFDLVSVCKVCGEKLP